MLNELYDLFQNMTKAFETLYVINGAKPVARMSFFENNLSKVEDFCKDNNLYFVTSDYKILMNFNGSYSTKGKTIPIDSPIRGYVFLYISKSEKKAEYAKELEVKNDYYKFGKLLGYPRCCRKFFVKNTEEEQKIRNDYVMPAVRRSKKKIFTFHNNIFGRYFDLTLLSHCPCSFLCKKSEHLGKTHLKIIKKHDADVASQVKDMLKSAVIYTQNGVYMLNNYKNIGNEIHFDNVLATNPNYFFDLLNKEKKLVIEKKNGYRLGKRKFNHPLLLFE